MERLMRKLTAAKNVFFCFLAFSVAWGEVAEGQVPVQSQYVRPSKGKAITVFSSEVGNGTSDVYDFTGFEAAQLFVTYTTPAAAVVVEVQGSTTAGGSYATGLDDPNSSRSFGGGGSCVTPCTTSYFVSELPPYIKVVLSNSGDTSTVTISMVPAPFSPTVSAIGELLQGTTIDLVDTRPVQVGAYDTASEIVRSLLTDASGNLKVDVSGGGTGGPINLVQVASSSTGLANTGVAGAATQRVVEATTIIATAPTEVSVASTAGGTLVHTANANHKSVIIQNDENIVVSCGQTSAVTATGPGNKLKACTADDDGTGGSVTYDSGADVYCIAASGTAQVNVQIISR